MAHIPGKLNAMWDVISSIATCIGVVVTGVGLWFVSRQIADTRGFAKAQFINELEKDINSHSSTYVKFLPGEAWSSTGPGFQTRAEISCVTAYLSFFEKLKLLLDINAIDLETADRMFAYRFFLVAHNSHVQSQILYDDNFKELFLAYFALHHDWHLYRKQNNLSIPFESTNLSAYDEPQYMTVVRRFKRMNR